jgi:ABC-type glycerol-3-phosphate transport system permease component
MDSMLQTRLPVSRTRRFQELIKTRASHIVLMALLYAFLILSAIVVLYPLAWMLGAAFKPDSEILSARLNPIPLNPTLEPMRTMFDTIPVVRNVLNSFVVAISSTILGLFFTSLGGYAFAKFNFPGNRILFYFILATMLVPPELNLVPSFLIMVRLGWVNTFWPLIIPGAASAFGIF